MGIKEICPLPQNDRKDHLVRLFPLAIQLLGKDLAFRHRSAWNGRGQLQGALHEWDNLLT